MHVRGRDPQLRIVQMDRHHSKPNLPIQYTEIIMLTNSRIPPSFHNCKAQRKHFYSKLAHKKEHRMTKSWYFKVLDGTVQTTAVPVA